MKPINAALLRMSAMPIAPREPSAPSAAGRPDFAALLRDAMGEANAEQVAVDNTVKDFISGGDVPIHQVMVALTEADLSMRLLTTVTQKVIQAYRELSQMQV